MITSQQLEIYKTLWKQSSMAAQHAHDGWFHLLQSQKNLIDGMCKQGIPLQVASAQFGKFMETHQQQHSAALEHMEKMAAEYHEALKTFKAK